MSEESKELTETRKVMLPELSDRGSLAVSLSRAEIDQQISTAHAWPRSVTRVMDNVMSLATRDEETAQECVYALPRAGKAVKGPSIRLAEIIASQWGNCRIGARVVHVDKFEKYVEAEGIFHDLETNAATTSRVRRRISDKEGRLLNEDMIMVTGNATCAIAKRNAILGGVPKAVWRRAYDSVESVIVGDVKTLVDRRDRSIKAFAAFGVKPEEIYAALGIAGENDITLEHLPTLFGMYSAIKNSEATVEEMFPKTRIKDGSTPKSLAERLNKLAGVVQLADGGTLRGAAAPPGNIYTVEVKEAGHDPETGEITAGSGNVFADIGLPNPEKELADAQAASEARRGRPPGSKNKPKEPESAPESALPVDEETAALLLAGTLAARVGHAEFKKWWGRLSAPDVERVEPHLEKLHAILAEKAANHGNE